LQPELYAHFHPEERPFVDKAWDWVVRAAERYAVKRTDFLDPRQAFILHSLANRHGGVRVGFYGGYEEAERKRAVIAPDGWDAETDDYGIRVLAITSDDAKFAELQHGDFLGALLGLGMKRDKIGDIHKGDGYCHALIAEEMADYANVHLRQVHRVRVQTDIIPPERLQIVPPRLERIGLTVSSLRLDGILSDVYRISRGKVTEPIKNGRCRVNWKVEEDPAKPLKEGDVVSFQGFGRFRVISVEGETKKGKIRVKIGKYV
jgi:RNA-binding protein YlmH